MNEPVKVGQVRQSEEYGPVQLASSHHSGSWFVLRMANDGCRGYPMPDIERMPLLCPAPEDLRRGDVLDGAGFRAILDTRQDNGKWTCEGQAGTINPTTLALRHRYRIVARGSEKAERYAVGVDVARPGGDLSAVSVVALEPDGTMRIVRTSGLPKADPAPFLPGAWVCMPSDGGRRDDRERDAYLVHSVNHVNGKWAVDARYSARSDACPIPAHYFIPAPLAVQNHAIRRWNRAAIEAARETPPRAVTSFGQRKGEAWERYQRQLAGLLERASGAEPWLIGSGHVADMLEGM